MRQIFVEYPEVNGYFVRVREALYGFESFRG